MSDGNKYKIGSLNPLYASRFRDNPETHYDRVKIGVMNKLIYNAYKPEKTFSGIGNLRGVVIRDNTEGLIDRLPWFSDAGIFSNVSDKYISIHVRIPEIHGFLPDPSEHEFGSPEFENITRLYPVFTGIEKTSRKPIYGDIVLVSFFNPKEKSSGGSYLETISATGDLIKEQAANGPLDMFGQSGKTVNVVKGDGIYVPGTGTVYEQIKGLVINGDPSFVVREIEPYYPTNLPLSKDKLRIIINIVSSGFTSRPDYVSTQDRLTMGFRRLASTGLDELLKKNYGMGTEEVNINNFAKAIEISDDPNWHKIQTEHWLRQVRSNLQLHTFKEGREIALFERVYNSNQVLAKANTGSYEQLKNAYIRHKSKDDKGAQRVARLEKTIPANEIWR